MKQRTAGRPPSDKTSADDSIRIRVTKERKKRWTDTAQQLQIPLSRFITLAADANCGLDQQPAK